MKDATPAELTHFRARVERAGVHFKEFGDTWAAYLDQRPHRFSTTVEDGAGTLRVHREIPIPNELSLVLGEFCYQLRAALDNCLYAAAVIDSGQNPPPGASQLQWPVCTTRGEWANQRRRLKYLNDELVNYLESMQPYNTEFQGWNCLLLLNELARVDRHRNLHPVGLYPVKAKIQHDRKLVHDIEMHPGVIDDGGVLVTFRYTGDEPIGRAHIDGNFEFDVELAGLVEAMAPDGDACRPYGSFEQRLRAIYEVTQEYMLTLVWGAQNPGQLVSSARATAETDGIDNP
jgi:hypothetical protein